MFAWKNYAQFAWVIIVNNRLGYLGVRFRPYIVGGLKRMLHKGVYIITAWGFHFYGQFIERDNFLGPDNLYANG